MNIDHVVLWVDSPKRSLEFYAGVVGLSPVRAQEYENGTASFPSVRLNDSTILDLMDRSSASGVKQLTGGGGGAGQPINHICLSMGADEFSALGARLVANGVELFSGGKQSFGAQGLAEKSAYFRDHDDNVVEMRYYNTDR